MTVILGTCPLQHPDCPCSKKPGAVDTSLPTLQFLLREVRGYLEKPGCNQPARVTAMTRLQWAVDEAEKRSLS